MKADHLAPREDMITPEQRAERDARVKDHAARVAEDLGRLGDAGVMRRHGGARVCRRCGHYLRSCGWPGELCRACVEDGEG